MIVQKRGFWLGAAIVFSIWLLGILALITGTLANARIGFVWPMGQDIDWSILLKQGAGRLAAEQEFTFDHRNPLSGWVYSLVAPLILGSPYGFHIVRLLCCLMLGLSVYGMIWRFCYGRALYFAVLVGTIISMWWFWSNFSQVVCLMLFALGLSTIVVWTYCAYVDSGRTKGALYGWSIVLWLIVLSTYTIQCGAIIPVFLVALLRGNSRGIWPAVRDTAPYLATGAIFAAIWIASAAGFFGEPAVAKTTHAEISWNALTLSIRYLFWHPIFPLLIGNALSSWPWAMLVLLALLLVPGLWLTKRLTVNPGTFNAAALRVGASWTVVVAFGLALPTVFLESTSSTWIPGTRSDMLFAAFIPMTVLGTTAMLASFCTQRTGARILFGVSIVLAGLIVPLNFEQNRQANVAYRWQKNLAEGISAYKFETAGPLHFIVINTSGSLQVGGDYAARFVQDKLNRLPLRWTQLAAASDTTMRFLEAGDPPDGYAGSWPVVYGPTLVVGALYGSSVPVPESSVRTFKFDGTVVKLIEGVQVSDLAGWRATVRDTD